MKGALVCFTGIDGSGKTTLARDLVMSLRQEGINAAYVYARYTPCLLRPLMLLGEHLFLRGQDPCLDYSSYSQTKKDTTKRKRLLSLVYQSLLMVDYFIQVFLKVWMPMLHGQSVVCDRYVYDTVANDLAIDFNYSWRAVDAVLEWWMRFLPKPNITVLVDVPEKLAYSRKNDISSLDYVKERRPLYQYMAQKLEMFTLDGSKDLNELRNIVLCEVLRRFRSNSI